MAETVIEAKRRTQSGSAAARRMRRMDEVPGIFYHHGQASQPFSMNTKALMALVHVDSALLDIVFDGTDRQKCVIREIQWHPTSHLPIHVDLMGVSMTEKISVEVPVRLLGVSYGVKTENGIMQQLMREIEVECLPSDIPDSIEMDVTDLKIGDSLHLYDIKLDKIKVLGDLDRPIVTISQLRMVEEAPVAAETTAAEPELIGKKAEDEEAEE
jgi:large subunit ribosomal protein L25